MKKKSLCCFSASYFNEFDQTLLRSIRERCERYDYGLFVVHGGSLQFQNQAASSGNALYRIVQPARFDAFLICGIFGHIEKAAAIEFVKPFMMRPVVTIIDKFPGIPTVRVDNAPGFRDLVTDLVADGRPHSYAVIAGPERHADSVERLATMQEVLKRNGIVVGSENMVRGLFEPISAVEAVRQLIDDRKASFDTLICFNDLMAIAAIGELRRRGFRIPEDVRVSGFDNLSISLFADPPLSTVDYPIRELGERGVDLIHSLLEGRKAPAEIVLTTRYVPRLSTGASQAEASGAAISARAGRRGKARARFPDDLFASILTGLEGLDLVGFTPVRRRWLKNTLGAVSERLATEDEGSEEFIEFLKRAVLGGPENEWSLPLWSAAFEMLSREGGLFPPSRRARVRDVLAAARYYAEAVASGAVVTRHNANEYGVRSLLQMGEDLGSAFALDAITGILARYSRHIGLRTCFVAIYNDKFMTRARLIARIEDYEEKAVGDFSDFDPRTILPESFLDTYPSLSMEALSAKNDNLGYILYRLGEHTGVFFSSLRQYIATAVKGALLVTTINRYSEGLERMVRERTAKLGELYQELKDEIGKREEAEKELLKQKNLESLGLLAGGIAHDFNNILTAVSGNLSMLQLDDGDQAERHAMYEGMMKAIKNAKNLTQQLLTFSMGGAPIKRAMPIVPLVSETARFLLRGTAVKPEFRFTGGTLNTEIDAAQISQVINNLVLNSLHAMPDGGSLAFSVDSVSVPPAGALKLEPGRYVRISIADTGHGIGPDIIDKIFDPYFTTKPKGSGLGLSTSLAIVRKHGGDIGVSSAVGKGAVFEVYLPASENAEAIAVDDPVSDVPGALRVLVLDDERDVRRVLASFLAKSRGQCDAVAEGREAVTKYEEAYRAGKVYDLVIMDLTVPGGMGGGEAMARILAFDPKARGIVSSGYSSVPILAEYRKFGFRSILRKPFTYDDFKKAVNEALRE